MENIHSQIEQMNKKHTIRRAWLRVLSVLVCITVFITTYALILPAVTQDASSDPDAVRINWGSISWNDTDKVYENASVSMDVKKDYTYYLQKSVDNGVTFSNVSGYSSGQIGQAAANTRIFANSDGLDTLLQSADLSTRFRVNAVPKDNKNPTYATLSYDFADLLDCVKEGFKEWLDGDFQTELEQDYPETKQGFTNAFDTYYHTPTAVLTVSPAQVSSNIEAITASVSLNPAGDYQYEWSYFNEETGLWTVVSGQTGDTLAITGQSSSLWPYGAEIRCRVLDSSGAFLTKSNIVYANPRQYDFDQAVSKINTGLGLAAYPANSGTVNLSINGDIFNNILYYEASAKNPDVPFEDAESYRRYLCKTYVKAVDSGKTEAEAIAEVRKVWNKYIYDIYDPDYTSMSDVGGTGYPGQGLGDPTLSYPKAVNPSFHGNITPVINQLDYSFLEDGIDYSNFISDMKKYAEADAAGDANTERKYDIDIVADGQAKARAPIALVFQVQSSWQMFDLNHANAVKNGSNVKVGRLGISDALATLYDLKWAILDFLDYMKEAYPGNNIVVGITEVQHDGSSSMFNDNGLYVTNDMEVLRTAVENWDIFGNCEHVHYDTNAITTAVSNLKSNLSNWKDFYGREVQYDDIRKIGVVVGGPTENDSGTNGYGCTVTWSAFANAKFNSVYGIQTNTGTPIPENTGGLMSWLELAANNGTSYKDGLGNTNNMGFTKKYVATSRAAIANVLREIADREFRVGGIDLLAVDKCVEDTYIKDNVRKEFEFDYSKPVVATILNKDDSKMFDLTITFAEDGQSVTSIIQKDYRTGNTTDITSAATLSIVNNTLTLSFDQTQTIRLNLTTGDEDRPIALENQLIIAKNSDGTTDVTYVFDKLYNTKKAELRFGVVAKEDYLGSNNVFTNTDCTSGYTHSKTVSGVTKTDEYRIFCLDNPQVNVPIEFATVNGGHVTIPVNTVQDLYDIEADPIPDMIEDLMDNYPQTNGKLIYEWVEPDGTTVKNCGEAIVKDGKVTGVRPNLADSITFSNTGDYFATLKLTFIPDPVKPDGEFHNGVTAEAVQKKKRSGTVTITVIDTDSTATIHAKKQWQDGNPSFDTIYFTVKNQDGDVLMESGSPRRFALTSTNDWEGTFDDLPALLNGEVQEYTVEEVEVPGYTPTISVDVDTKYTYAASMGIDFTPTVATGGSKRVRITYEYNGETKSATFSAETINAGTTKNYLIDSLLTTPEGNAFAAAVKKVEFLNTDDSVYTTFVPASYDPYNVETDRRGYPVFMFTLGQAVQKKKSISITYHDSDGVISGTKTFTYNVAIDIASGSELTLTDTSILLPEGDSVIVDSAQIVIDNNNKPDITTSVTAALKMITPTVKFTTPIEVKKDKLIRVTVTDGGNPPNEFTEEVKLTSNYAAGSEVILTLSSYMPESNYHVSALTYVDGNNETAIAKKTTISFTTPEKIPKDKAVAVTLTNGTQTYPLTKSFNNDIQAGGTVTMVFDSEHPPDGIYTVASIKVAGNDLKTPTTLTFTNTTNADIDNAKTLTFYLTDDNGDTYTVTGTTTAKITKGNSGTVKLNFADADPQRVYTVTKITVPKGGANVDEITGEGVIVTEFTVGNTYPDATIEIGGVLPQNSVVNGEKVGFTTQMIAPDTIPSGTDVTVNYTVDGVAGSYTVTTGTQTEAGDWASFAGPVIDGGTIAITSVTYKVGNTQVPYYSRLNADFEVNTRVSSAISTPTFTIVNKPVVLMPSTGGGGTQIYTTVGIAFIVIPLIIGAVLRRKRERRYY